jgi:hypothetical protein
MVMITPSETRARSVTEGAQDSPSSDAHFSAINEKRARTPPYDRKEAAPSLGTETGWKIEHRCKRCLLP